MKFKHLYFMCISLLAVTAEASWQSGIDKLKAAALNSKYEKSAVYVSVGNDDALGAWVFPWQQEAGADVIWTSGNELRELMLAGLDSVDKERRRLGERVLVVFAHTHPLATLRSFIDDPVKRPEVFESGVSVRPSGRLTISPSRSDMDVAHSVDGIFKRSLNDLGYTAVVVSNVVVDPAGIYRYRSFSNIKERNRYFPELSGKAPFDWLDNEAQAAALAEMSREFFAAKVAWTTLLNVSSEPFSKLEASGEFERLRRTYAAFGKGVLLEFEEH